MTKTVAGSDRLNGMPMPVKRYLAGQEYDIGEELAAAFSQMGVIEIHAQPKIQEGSRVIRRKKDLGKAPENKDLGEE